MNKELLIDKLNADITEERLSALTELKKLIDAGEIAAPVSEGYTNNHVHTKYSFSPYSPTKAVWTAYMSGLDTVGIIDHDAINGALEFAEAGRILGIATTSGFEIRTDWSATALSGRRINSPDQKSNAYICVHGVPSTQIEEADDYLKTIRSAREKRNRAMTKRLNDIMRIHDINVDYDSDVLPLSYAEFGGEVTERHLLFALSHKIIDKFGKGQELIDFISGKLGIKLSDKQLALLKDSGCAIYDYDVLNILKSDFISGIFIDAEGEETPPVSEAVKFIKSIGAIPTYCYLGDVKASPTGDKKEQKFEDDYLEEVFAECRKIGFDAIAFMPSRNTKEQLERVMELCDKYGFMQISGEDINQPRQSFVCRELKEKRYAHLTDAAWALTGHEMMAAEDLSKGLFGDNIGLDSETIKKRILRYSKTGMEGKK
jgi:hypothetical protein